MPCFLDFTDFPMPSLLLHFTNSPSGLPQVGYCVKMPSAQCVLSR